MNVLKGLVLSLLSFLLFLSISIFGIAFTLSNTLLNPDFVASEVDRIDASSLIRELTEEQLSAQIPQEMRFLKETIYNVISDQEPWIKEQVNAAIYSGYDFLLGKSERLSLVIPLEPLKESLRESIWQTFLQSLPPQLSGLPPALVEQYFNQSYQEFASQIPTEINLNESFIPPEAMSLIIQVRQGISYFQTGYSILIGFIVLLVLGIILINRNVRSITRGLGTTFLIYGATEYAGIFLARHFVPSNIPMSEIPSTLQMWLLQLFGDILKPLEMFSLGFLAGGIILLAVSFIYKPRMAED